MTRLTIPVWGLVLLAAPVSAAAQPTAPAHVSQVDGQATVARLSGAQSAVADLPLLPGDRVQTDQGRVELLFGDGAIVHMDEQTTVDVNAGNVAQLLGGRLVVAADAAGGSLQVDASPASVRLVDSGEVRLVLDASSGTPLLDVGVVRGEVEVASEAGVETVRAGEHVVVSEGEAPSPPVAFNSAREDGFFRWSNALLDSRRGTTSAAYLPSDLETYAGTLDQYGSWAYQAPYGYVWYPAVAPAWRPYHHGRWQHVGGIGWTFLARDPWGWPTHHYGRWGATAGGTWFWIPSAGWSAAWVEWAVAPGYVGWCPLGWDDRPAGRFWTGGGRAGAHPEHHGRGWSVVPTTAFARGGDVTGAAVDPAAYRGSRLPAFAFQRTAPSVAIPRGTLSIPNGRVPIPRDTVVVPSRRVVLPGTSSASREQAGRGSPVTTPPRDRRPAGAPVAASSEFGGTPPPNRAATDPGTRSGHSRVMRTPAPSAPPVIYYRGSAIPPDSQRGAASTYERAGIAVPRSLPAGATAGAPPSGGSVTGPSRGMPAFRSGVGSRPVTPGAPAAPRGGSFRAPGGPQPGAPVAPPVAAPRAPAAGAPSTGSSPRSGAGAPAQGTAAPRSGNPHR